jgi:hypothetical protein
VVAFRKLLELVRRLEGASDVRRPTLQDRIGTPILTSLTSTLFVRLVLDS